MASLAMTPVVVLCIEETVDLPHPVRQIALRRFNQEVVMVIHEAIRVAEPMIPLDDLGEQARKALPICVIRVDGRTRVAAASHMINSARKFETQGSCHRRTILSLFYADHAVIAGHPSVPNGA
jgi:hypothetical protein